MSGSAGQYSYDVDRIETRFAKSILKLPVSTASAGVMLEMDRVLSLTWKAKLRAVKYWLKILAMPETRYVKQAYYVQRSLKTTESWAHGVKSTLFTLGFGDVWTSESPHVYRGFLSQLKLRAAAQAHGELLEDVQDKPSLEYLRRYKLQRERDTTLMRMRGEDRRAILLGRLKCLTFTQFEVSHGVRRRKCMLCDAVITNEWDHVLEECQALATERETTGREIQRTIRVTSLFTPNQYAATARFIRRGMHLRDRRCAPSVG